MSLFGVIVKMLGLVEDDLDENDDVTSDVNNGKRMEDIAEEDITDEEQEEANKITNSYYDFLKEKTGAKNVTEYQAIHIADDNGAMKCDFYNRNKKYDLFYGWLDFKELHLQKVKYKMPNVVEDIIEKNKYIEKDAWYVRVVGGDWGKTKRKVNPVTKESKIVYNSDGRFCEDCNIGCLVLIEDGKYIYASKKVKENIIFTKGNKIEKYKKEKGKSGNEDFLIVEKTLKILLI